MGCDNPKDLADNVGDILTEQTYGSISLVAKLHPFTATVA